MLLDQREEIVVLLEIRQLEIGIARYAKRVIPFHLHPGKQSAEIRADDLKGTTVYGANDARVGEIGDVVLAPDKKADAVIVDVGGFLGIGEKEVAVGMDNLKFMTDKDGNKYLYTTFTKEQLEAQTAYDKGSYAEQRDQQRMIVQ